MASSVQPEDITGVESFGEYPLYLFSRDTPDRGLIGVCDPFIKTVFGVKDQDSKTDLTRIVFGAANTSSLNLSVPWDGTTTPRANSSREGISSTLP